MPPPAGPSFAHRNNPDGTTDSICRRCFVTVSNSIWEAELERAERDHICDPATLRQWRNYGNGPPGESKSSVS